MIPLALITLAGLPPRRPVCQLAPCPVGLPVLVRWQWWRRLAAQREAPRGHRINLAAVAAASAAACKAAAARFSAGLCCWTLEFPAGSGPAAAEALAALAEWSLSLSWNFKRTVKIVWKRVEAGSEDAEMKNQ